MSTLKYSRQRAAIKKYLSSTKAHPTADSVYLHVKKEFPNISLGTVYRNLNLLSARGEIRKISSNEGGDRFDGDISPHYHFFCSSCGKVLDLNINTMDQINQIAGQDFHGSIEFHQISFHGKCQECLKDPKEGINVDDLSR